MRAAFVIVILSVLTYSTAISSTSFKDSGKINLSNQDDDKKILSPDQLSCTTCNILTLITKEKFESIGREEMMARVLHECYSLDIMSETCANTVFNYFDLLYDIVKTQLQSYTICADSGICKYNDGQWESVEMTYPTRNDKFYCAECKKIADYMYETMIKNMTEPQFKTKLTGLCKLTYSFSPECVKIVDQYSHVIYKLVKDMKPDSICLIIGVCHNKRKENEDKIVEATENSEEQLQLITSALEKKSETCALCENVIKTCQKLVKEHYDFKIFFKYICRNLKEQSLKDKCDTMIGNHKDLIIDLVMKNATYQQICRSLSMCLLLEPQTSNKFELEMPQPNINEYQRRLSECGICGIVMRKLTEIDYHGDKNKIKMALLLSCHYIGRQRDQCEEMISIYSDQIINLVAKHTKPRYICHAIGKCKTFSVKNFENDMSLPEEQQEHLDDGKSSTSICELWELIVNENEQSNDQLENGPFCIICELLLAKLKTFVDSKAKRIHIQHLFLHTCDILPESIRKKCQSIVYGFGLAFLHLLSKVTPHELCYFLRISVNQTVLQDFNESLTVYLDTNCALSPF